TFADMLTNHAQGASIVPGHTFAFLITSVLPGGTLKINGNTVTTPQVFKSGDTLVWTPAGSVTGVSEAFDVVGYDIQNASTAPLLSKSSPAVPVNVNVTDPTPTLTHVNTLGVAGKNSPFLISFGSLLNAADETFAAGHAPGFLITEITSGTLK